MKKKSKPRKSSVVSSRREFEKKVADYRKFLKDDHDWDYDYILKLLKYKLGRTRKCIVANDIVVGAKKTGRQILAVENLLQRVIENQYLESISGDFHKRYGKFKMKFKKPAKGARGIEVNSFFDRETPQNSKQLRREFRVLMRRADRLKQRDLAKAFGLIQKNIWCWWD
jgi:hypothetical protein